MTKDMEFTNQIDIGVYDETDVPLKEKLNVPVPPTNLKKKSKKFQYILPISIFMIVIAILIFLFVFKVNVIWIIIYSILAFPLVAGSFLWVFIRLYLDKRKITEALYKSFSGRVLIANFYMPQKRILQRIVRVSQDGISFLLGNQRYIIDHKKIWKDEDGYPNSYYMPNLPNPLGFDFQKYIKNYLGKLKDGEPEKALDDFGDIIDVTYSSENLEQFRKDKIFAEFHNKNTPEIMKLVYAMVGVIGVAFIVIMIVVIVR